jgi:5'-nucleotidase / UDP-sugar diphosphatase
MLPRPTFAIQNSGGCRESIPAGDITYGLLFKILPFANTLVKFNMTGAQIKSVLEDSVNFFLNETIGGTGSYPYAAGLRWAVNYTAPFGSRFSEIEVNRRLDERWTPLDAEETYTVVTNSFVGEGRDGYFSRLEPTVQATYVDTFVEYVR